GNDEHLSLRVIADLIVAAAGSGSVETVPWPPDRDAIDIGSYFGDSSKAKRVLGWSPEVTFADGSERTVGVYRQHLSRDLLAGWRLRCPASGSLISRGGRPPSSPSFRRRSPPYSRAACSCSGPRPRRSRPSSPRSAGAVTRSRWPRARRHCASRWSRWM